MSVLFGSLLRGLILPVVPRSSRPSLREERQLIVQFGLVYDGRTYVWTAAQRCFGSVAVGPGTNSTDEISCTETIRGIPSAQLRTYTEPSNPPFPPKSQ